MMQHSPAMSSPTEPLAPDASGDSSTTPTNPDRRRLLKLGAGAGVLFVIAGTGAALWSPGWRGGQLSPSGRALFSSVAQAVLDGSLPADEPRRARAVEATIARLEVALAGLPGATRDQVSQLIGLLQLGPARRWLCGLEPSWQAASPREVERALERMRMARDELRQQVYHALRDLVSASYFSDPSTWTQLGYPGPTAL
jgi:hypothetical protein